MALVEVKSYKQQTLVMGIAERQKCSRFGLILYGKNDVKWEKLIFLFDISLPQHVKVATQYHN